MKKMNENQMKNLEGGKFWGWSCGVEWYTPTGECYQSCSYYVLWTSTGTGLYGCGEH